MEIAAYLIYSLIPIAATLLGSISGMGGGGIMKPIFDACGFHTAKDIATLTMFSTFAMAIFSLAATLLFFKKDKKINYKLFLFIAIGAVLGGLTGKILFNVINKYANDQIVKIVQNSIFAILIIGVIVYLFNINKTKTLNLKNILFGLPVGFALGLISGFLSIGGGQFNVPVIMFFFGLDIKLSVLASLTIILFSQCSNIITMLIQTQGSGIILEKYPYAILCVILASLVGAIIGRIIAKKINLKNTKYFCIGTNTLIFGICIYNIISLSLKL